MRRPTRRFRGMFGPGLVALGAAACSLASRSGGLQAPPDRGDGWVTARPGGRSFSYGTAGAVVLGEVLRRATGLPADACAARRLFGPLGIRHVSWVSSPLGLPMTGGGLRIRSRDLLRLARLCLDDGLFEGTGIVSSSWVEASIRPHVRIDGRTEYGSFWWLRTFTGRGRTFPAVDMSGNGGNKVVLVPGQRLVAVITSTNYSARGMHGQTDRLLADDVLDAVVTPSGPSPRE